MHTQQAECFQPPVNLSCETLSSYTCSITQFPGDLQSHFNQLHLSQIYLAAQRPQIDHQMRLGEKGRNCFCVYITPSSSPNLITVSFQRENRQVNGARYSFHLWFSGASPFCKTLFILIWAQGSLRDHRCRSWLGISAYIPTSLFTHHWFSVWLTAAWRRPQPLLVEYSVCRNPTETAHVSFAWVIFQRVCLSTFGAFDCAHFSTEKPLH